MDYIKIWCEYDFGGDFGGVNNEDCYRVNEGMSVEEVEDSVLAILSDTTGLSRDELEEDNLYGWEYITVLSL